MSEAVIMWLFGVLLTLMISFFAYSVKSNTDIAKKMGSIETGLNNVHLEQSRVAIALAETSKKSCPFPACPVFMRAIEEAAPSREKELNSE